MTTNEKELFNKLHEDLQFYCPYFSKMDITFVLVDLTQTHGNDAMIGMHGFIKWSKANKYAPTSIVTTLSHDIASRNDKDVLLKTDGYKEYATMI